MTRNETEPVEGTREQLETLARWMGWEVHYTPDGLTSWTNSPVGLSPFHYLSGSVGPTWHPFTDANADYQVLERARQVWGGPVTAPWYRFSEEAGFLAFRYEVGDYARAVLAVLGKP